MGGPGLRVFAVDYDAANGTVEIAREESGVVSWQGSSERSNDNVINITGTAGESTVVKIDNDVKDVTVNVTYVKAAVTESHKGAIEIGTGTENVTVNVENTTIDLQANATSGVVAKGDATLNFNGENTISSTTLDDLCKSVDGVKPTNVTIEGISVGNGASDGSDSAKDAAGNAANVVISTTQEGSSLNISGTADGIIGRRGTEVTIDGNGTDDTVSDALEVNITDTIRSTTTTAGNGIKTYGDLTITDNAVVTIDGVKDAGENACTFANVNSGIQHSGATIENGAVVTISHVEKGAGIYSEPGDLTISNAIVTITDTEKQGIGAMTSNITIEDGAKVTLDRANYGEEVSGIVLTSGSEHSTLTVRGEDTVLTMDHQTGHGINAYADVNIYDGATVLVGTKGSSGEDALRMAEGYTCTIEDATVVLNNDDYGVRMDKNSKVEIRNNADVTATNLKAKGGLNGQQLIVIGGTLALTQEGTGAKAGLTNSYYRTLPDEAETAENTLLIWPTNGEVYGNEKLVNFQLPADEAHALFQTFGWTDEAVEYLSSNVTALGKTYSDGYACDLSKYGEGEMLSVWVPAIVLDYLYRDQLPDGTRIEDMTEEQLQELLDGIIGKDAIIRGRSIEFATLNGAYTSTNPEDATKEWYYFDLADKIGSFTAKTPMLAKTMASIYGLEVIPVPDEDPGEEPEVVPAPVPAPVPPIIPFVPAPIPEPDVERIVNDPTPLAGTEIVEDEETPLAGGGVAWALYNFALMELAIFESLALLAAYFKKERKDREDEKQLRKKLLPRLLSVLIAVGSVIAFVLTEDIHVPLVLIDRWTPLMVAFAAGQTGMVAFSRKSFRKEDTPRAAAAA